MIKKTVTAPTQENGVKMYSSNTGCCPTGLSQCKYSLATATAATAVRNITVTLPDGTDVVWTLAAADYASAAALKEFIRTKCKAIGYEFSEYDGIESNAISVAINTTDNTIDIISELVFKSILNASSATVLFEAFCTRVSQCVFEVAFAGGTDPSFELAGTSYSLSGGFPYSGNSSNDATTATQIEAAIIAALTAVLDTDYYSVSVEADPLADSGDENAPGAFVISLTAPYGTVFTFASVAAGQTEDACVQGWIE